MAASDYASYAAERMANLASRHAPRAGGDSLLGSLAARMAQEASLPARPMPAPPLPQVPLPPPPMPTYRAAPPIPLPPPLPPPPLDPMFGAALAGANLLGPTAVQPATMGWRQDEEEVWILVEYPDGQKVAMPKERINEAPPGSVQIGPDITDPEAIARAKVSEYAIDNEAIRTESGQVVGVQRRATARNEGGMIRGPEDMIARGIAPASDPGRAVGTDPLVDSILDTVRDTARQAVEETPAAAQAAVFAEAQARSQGQAAPIDPKDVGQGVRPGAVVVQNRIEPDGQYVVLRDQTNDQLILVSAADYAQVYTTDPRYQKQAEVRGDQATGLDLPLTTTAPTAAQVEQAEIARTPSPIGPTRIKEGLANLGDSVAETVREAGAATDAALLEGAQVINEAMPDLVSEGVYQVSRVRNLPGVQAAIGAIPDEVKAGMRMIWEPLSKALVEGTDYTTGTLIENILRASRGEDFEIPLSFNLPGERADFDLPDIPIPAQLIPGDENIRAAAIAINTLAAAQGGRTLEQIAAEDGDRAAFDHLLNMATGDDGVGMLMRLVVEVAMDPLTYLALGGVAGQGLRRVGRLRTAAAATPAGIRTGRAIEALGTGIYRGSRIAEGVADLGLPLVPMAARGAYRRLPEGLLKPAEVLRARQLDRQRAALGTMIRRDNIAPEDIVDTAAGETGPGTAPPTTPTSLAPLTRPGTPPAPIRPRRGAMDTPASPVEGAAARIPQVDEPTVAEVPMGRNVPYSPSVRISRVDDGWTVDTIEPQADGRRVLRRSRDARTWPEAVKDAETARRILADPPDSIRLGAAATTPGRFEPDPTRDRMVDQIARADPPGFATLRQVMNDDWNRHTKAMAAMGRGTAGPDAAIATSAVMRRTAAAYQTINPQAVIPAQRAYEGMGASPAFRQVEGVLNDTRWTTPQGQTNPAKTARAALYQAGVIRTTMPSPTEKTPIDVQQAAANRYVDLVTEYAARHPEALADPDFAADYATARALDDSLRAAGIRRRGARRTKSGRAPSRRPATAAAPKDRQTQPDVDTRRSRQMRVVDPITGQASVRKVKVGRQATAAQRGGYDVVAADPDAPDNLEVVALDENTTVEVVDVDRRDVSETERALFPDAANRVWAEATLRDASLIENPNVGSFTAPERDMAVRMAAVKAQDLGLIGGAADLEARALVPETIATTPEPAAALETPPLVATDTPPTPPPVVPAEPAQPVADLAAPGERTTDADTILIDPDRIAIDPAFQPRRALNERFIEEAVDNFKAHRFETPVLWERGPDDYVVMFGHHRREIAKRLKAAGRIDKLRATVFRGTREEATIEAVTSNKGRQTQKPTENMQSIQALQGAGVGPERVKELMDNMSDRTVRDHLSLVHLPDDLKDTLDANYNPDGEQIHSTGLTLRKGAEMGRMIEDGLFDGAGAQAFYVNEMATAGWSDTAFADVVKALRTMRQNAGTGKLALFDVGDFATPQATSVFAQLRDWRAKKEALASNRRNVTSTIKKNELTPRTRRELEHTATRLEAEIAQLETDLGITAAPKKAARRAAAPKTTTPEPAPARPRTGMDLGEAGRPVLQQGGTTPGEAVTADDLLAEPELTPAEIAARERAAGQADMFGIGGNLERQAADSTTVFAMWGPGAAKEWADAARSIRALAPSLRFTSRRGPNAVTERRGLVMDGGAEVYARGRVVFADEQAALTSITLANGKTPLDRWVELSDQFEAGAAGVGTGKPRKLAPDVAEKRAADQVMEESEAALKKINPTRNLRDARIKGVHVGKPVDWILKAIDGTLTLLRQKVLGSWFGALGYPGSQAFGNSLNLMVGGRFDEARRLWNLKQVAVEYQRLRNEGARRRAAGFDQWDDDPWDTAANNLARRLGIKVPDNVSGSMSSQTPLDDHTLIQRAARKLRIGWLGTVAADQRILTLGGAYDLHSRGLLWEGQLMEQMPEAVASFRTQATERLVRGGFDPDTARQTLDRFFEATPDGIFKPDQVRRYFRDYLTPGQADRLSRDWGNAVNTMSRNGTSEVQRVLHNFETTRFDVALNRTIFFHRFFTRQYGFLINQGINHPALLNAYFNLREEYERYAETHDMPDYLEGFLKVWMLPGGFQLLLKPHALAQVYTIFGDTPGFKPEGMSALGEWIFDHQWLGFNPIIMETLNLSGAMGDTFAPDPFKLWNESNFATYLINVARYNGFGADPTPVGNWYTDLMANARETTSGIIPGTEKVRAKSDQAMVDRQVQALIVDEAKKQGIDPETPEGRAEIAAAYNDPQSPLYQAGLKRYILGEGAEIVARFLLAPFRPKTRAANAEGDDLMTNLTEEERSLVNTTDPFTRNLRTQMDAYYGLGSQQDRVVTDIYTTIRYGEVQHVVVVNGTTYEPDEVNAMSDEQRGALAMALLAEYGLTDQWEAQKQRQAEFKADPNNREYAQFVAWQEGVRNHPGGPEQYWKDTIEENPNARIFYEGIVVPTEAGAVANTGKGLDRPLSDAQREKALTSTTAFLAVKGNSASAWDPEPERTSLAEGGGVYDPTMVASQPAKPIAVEEPSNEFETELREGLPKLDAELATYEQAVDAQMTALGLDPAIPLNQLPYEAEKLVKDSLEEQGVDGPYTPYPVQQYLDWVQQQPPGSDTSIDAFLAYEDAQYEAAAPARFETAMQPVRPDSDLATQIIGMLAEHEYRTSAQRTYPTAEDPTFLDFLLSQM